MSSPCRNPPVHVSPSALSSYEYLLSAYCPITAPKSGWSLTLSTLPRVRPGLFFGFRRRVAVRFIKLVSKLLRVRQLDLPRCEAWLCRAYPDQPHFKGKTVVNAGRAATNLAGTAPVTSAPSERRGRASGRSHANFVVGGVATMVLFAAFALALPMIGSKEVSSLPPQTTDPHWDVVGTILFPPSGAFCRQLSIDNNTGAITQGSFVRCIDAQLGRVHSAATDAANIGPLEGIRRSFAVGR